MDEQRLQQILDGMAGRRVLVVGDFFLDEYLFIEQSLAETSLETGLEAHQVIERRCSAGAAGNVAANVAALGAQAITVGVIGDDGAGYELRRVLHAAGADTGALIAERSRFTPTYTKPMLRRRDGSQNELNRLDVKNRTALPDAVERQVIALVRQLVPSVDAVIIADQVQEADCGVVTRRVRDELCALARAHPSVIVAADSRERIGLYRDVILKPNEREAAQAVGLHRENPSEDEIMACGERLWQNSRRVVFLTRGEKGIGVFNSGRRSSVPAWPVSPPLDTVGAGDTALASLVCALAAGAGDVEAACIATLATAITIKQIGTTGVASRRQIADLFSSR
jgi:rfaE bifunctional protein kinase chain/domain